MAQINQYANEAVTLKGGDLFDIDHHIEGTSYQSQKVDWLTMVNELQSQLTFNNIGNSDLVITDTVRKLRLSGDTHGSSWGVYNNAGTTPYIIAYGDDLVEIPSNLGLNGAPASGFWGLNMLGDIRTTGNIILGTTFRFNDSGFSQFTSSGGFELNSRFAGGHNWGTNSTIHMALSGSGVLTFSDAVNMVFGETTGTEIGTTSTQKLSFWGVSPVAQPTNAITAAAFVANTSGISDDSATFGGYTMGQIVAALKLIGILQ